MVPQQGIGLHSPIRPRMPEQRAIASYERELAEYEGALLQLRGRLSRQETLGRQKDDLILQQEVLGREAEHRLLNGLQMTVSLLSLQSRAETNVEASLQLAVAANRVATIARVHRRLQSLGGAQAVRFKRCLEDLCGEYSEMRVAEQQPGPAILVEGIEITVATATAMPLSLIANELVTNAIKHGKGQIKVALEAHPEKGHALSVSNDGPPLPDGFDPAASDGLGMSIISALVGQIGGKLRTGRGDNGRGARFTVLFS